MAFSLAQTNLKGVVLDSLSGKPVEGASIYFNGSQTGTTSNKQGIFNLKLPSTLQQLVFSAVGFNTVLFSTEDIVNPKGSEFVIKLIRKENELEEVVVKAVTYHGVDNKFWRKKFRDYFIGTVEGTNECVIKNFEDIVLKLSQKEDVLRARANKTIEIINNWLGYKIYFDLEECTIDLNANSFYNQGYARFEDISNGNRKIQKRREDVYHGSLPHFLKSLYNDSLHSQGFEVRGARVVPNTERARIKELMDKNKHNVRIGPGTLQIAKSSPDSSAYYYTVYVRQADQIISIDSIRLNAGDLFITDVELFKELYFDNYLLVTYKGNKSGQPGLNPVMRTLEASQAYQNSFLSLKDNNSVFVFPNGRVSPAKILLVQGYWYTVNNVQNMLPSDY
ncbi:MAG: carboxypeptidase-like regulatory domain-containing protein [Bacteroidota bacterium]